MNHGTEASLAHGGAFDSLLRTSVETAIALRQCDADSTPEEKAAAVRTVHRLTRERGLRPVKIGKAYFYSVEAAVFVGG